MSSPRRRSRKALTRKSCKRMSLWYATTPGMTLISSKRYDAIGSIYWLAADASHSISCRVAYPYTSSGCAGAWARRCTRRTLVTESTNAYLSASLNKSERSKGSGITVEGSYRIDWSLVSAGSSVGGVGGSCKRRSSAISLPLCS
jgi:hypothetical protein